MADAAAAAAVVKETFKLGEARTFPGSALIARDLDAKESKRYTVYGSGAGGVGPLQDEHAYEVILPEQPRRLFIDVEFPDSHPFLPEVEVLAKIQEAVNLFLIQKKGVDFKVISTQVATASGMITKEGPWKGLFKHSYHILFHLKNGGVIRDVYDHKLFWEEFVQFAESLMASPTEFAQQLYWLPLRFKDSKGQDRWCFDHGIQKHFQCYRMLYQSKFGQGRTLKPVPPSSPNPMDHLVAIPLTHQFPPFIPFQHQQQQRDEQRHRCVSYFASSGRFPYEDVERQLLEAHPEDAPFRQICMVNEEGIWTKKYFLSALKPKDLPEGELPKSCASSLRCLLGKHAPAEVHVGPFRASPKKDSPAMGRELTFDIDLNDYDRSFRRRCECRGSKRCCRDCWIYCEYAIRAVSWLMDHLFGFRQVQAYFSGNKGCHIWIRDPEACALKDRHREALLKKLNHSLEGGLLESDPPMGALFYKEITSLWASALYVRMPAVRRYLDVKQQGGRLDRRLLEYQALQPMFDAPVTTHVEHNIKIFYSMHPTSGRIAVPLPIPKDPFDHEKILFLD